MKYSIEGQELTNIADALRRRHGEFEILDVNEKVETKISKTQNATGFNSFDDTRHESEPFFDVVTIEGADKIKVKMVYSLSSGLQTMQVVAGEHTEKSYFVDQTKYYSSGEINLEFEGNTVTFYFNPNPYGGRTNHGYYAECDGYVTTRSIKRVYKSSEMAQAIDDIEIGAILPKEAFEISNDCTYRFAYDNWTWFIETFRDKLTTNDITGGNGFFYAAKALKEIPFVINIKNKEGVSLASCCYGCQALTQAPIFNIPNARKLDLNSLFSNCFCLRDANNVFQNEDEFFASWQGYANTTNFGGHYAGSLFNTCYSLRTVPDWFYKFKLNPESTAYPYNSHTIYSGTFNNTSSLDEIKNIPVWKCKGVMNNNMFSTAFTHVGRVKDITFETNEDGSPIVTEWKNQIIDLQYGVGFVSNKTNVINYNSGINSSKMVTDDKSYHELKNDPDWFTTIYSYSRYNHDSAVNTINSLPDTSAYLATAGGSNTIKFKGASGSATDGGAINTLTEEEIAIATAKGWTVTFV